MYSVITFCGYEQAKVVWTDSMHAHHPAIQQEYIMVSDNIVLALHLIIDLCYLIISA